MRGTRGDRAPDERGAVVVIVALVAIVLFGAAAYAIDAGNLWQTRRNMVTATDAAALAAAGKYAIGADGCSVAPQFVTANRAGAALDACNPSTTNTNDGYVTVSGHTNVPLSFAGIFGMTNKQVNSATTARWGIPSGAQGLRPIALCLTSTPALEQWLNLPSGPTGPTASPIKITLSNSQPDACKDGNNAAGNWGLAFGNGNNSNSDTINWLANGYPDAVSVGDDIHANTGAFSGSLQSELQTLVDNQTWFALPVFDRVDGGNGNNASYHVVAFVYVQLVSYDVSGAQANRFITVNLDRGVIQGPCCGSGPDTGTRVVHICDVDAINPDTSANAC
jgi:hypothetical protein